MHLGWRICGESLQSDHNRILDFFGRVFHRRHSISAPSKVTTELLPPLARSPSPDGGGLERASFSPRVVEDWNTLHSSNLSPTTPRQKRIPFSLRARKAGASRKPQGLRFILAHASASCAYGALHFFRPPPSGEVSGAKTGSVFAPRLYPSPPKCGRRFGFAENGDSRGRGRRPRRPASLLRRVPMTFFGQIKA